MKILYIHQYFTTPSIGGGTRSYEFAKYFLKQGHQVVMLTSYNNKAKKREYIDGIDVVWIPNYYDNRMGIMPRVISYFNFTIKSFITGLKEKNIDICFATSTPLTVGITTILIRWIKRIPYIFEVRDLWPEFPIQMGAIPNKTLQKLAYLMEKMIYKNAKSIIALSPGMKEGIEKYKLKQNVITVPNSADLNLFFPHNKSQEIIDKFGLKNKFSSIYFGTLGLANGVEYIIEAAKILQKDEYDEFLFIIVGKGRQEELLKTQASEYGLKNIRFYRFMPKIELAELVNCCDVSLTTFINKPILYTNSPNKLFDSLSAGKICIVNSNGWTRKLLEDSGCGFYVDPENPSDLSKILLQIKNNEKLQLRMEEKARKLAEDQFDRVKLADMVLKELETYAK